MSLVSDLYARLARSRRSAWERPGRQRRLGQPVISIGNLRVGGTGKTPVTACVARVLLDLGERPAILSRGYGRRTVVDGVVVVSDGSTLRADLDRAGDEPLMLARSLPGVVVCVCANRYRAGHLAETSLGATVHLLDDGFQHLALARDTDLVIVTSDDVRDPRTLPAGRLRESLDTAGRADAVLVPGATPVEAADVGRRLGAPQAFSVRTSIGPPRRLDAAGAPAPLEPGMPVLAVAGIARPERFFTDVEKTGHPVAGTMVFRDHHRFSASDVRDMEAAASQLGAGAILTTEKDLVRLLRFRPWPLPLAWLPLAASIEPAAGFRAWLGARLQGARAAATRGADMRGNG